MCDQRADLLVQSRENDEGSQLLTGALSHCRGRAKHSIICLIGEKRFTSHRLNTDRKMSLALRKVKPISLCEPTTGNQNKIPQNQD